MAQTSKGTWVKGPCKTRCRDLCHLFFVLYIPIFGMFLCHLPGEDSIPFLTFRIFFKWVGWNSTHQTSWKLGALKFILESPNRASKTFTRLWIQAFFIFTPYLLGNDPIWRAYYFRWVGSTNQIYIPRSQMIPIFEGQPPKTRPFPIKTRVIWASFTDLFWSVLLSVLPSAPGTFWSCRATSMASKCNAAKNEESCIRWASMGGGGGRLGSKSGLPPQKKTVTMGTHNLHF